MKTLLSTAMLAAIFSLIGCGGGSDAGGSTDTTTPTTPPSSTGNSNDLIIDNGRGTLNNQDTESAQN